MSWNQNSLYMHEFLSNFFNFSWNIIGLVKAFLGFLLLKTRSKTRFSAGFSRRLMTFFETRNFIFVCSREYLLPHEHLWRSYFSIRIKWTSQHSSSRSAHPSIFGVENCVTQKHETFFLLMNFLTDKANIGAERGTTQQLEMAVLGTGREEKTFAEFFNYKVSFCRGIAFIISQSTDCWAFELSLSASVVKITLRLEHFRWENLESQNSFVQIAIHEMASEKV